MKKRRILTICLVLLLAISSIYLLQSTYAKYRKKVEQGVELSLARWNIKLNNQSIAGKTAVSSDVTPYFETNENIAENVLAPGVTGYFDIEIDASDVDVSFNYLLNIVQNEQYPDIIAYGYSLDPTSNTILDIPEEGITGDIVYNTPLTKLRIYIKWDDSSNNVMDNAADTALAINNSTFTLTASFIFTQINQ